MSAEHLRGAAGHRDGCCLGKGDLAPKCDHVVLPDEGLLGEAVAVFGHAEHAVPDFHP